MTDREALKLALETLNQKLIKELFDYQNGQLIWKVDRHRKKTKGTVAGSNCNTGYIRIQINGKSYVAHRIVWIYYYSELPDGEIDHINGDKKDNRIENLRASTRHQNNQNVRLIKTNVSGMKGVSWDKQKQKWRVQVGINGKQKMFGHYKDAELADLVAVMAREKYHKEFANHG